VWFGSTRVREARWAGETRVRVANKRAEMWTNLRAWLGGAGAGAWEEFDGGGGGCIPDHQGLADDLTGPHYGFNADQAVLLEEKKHMKARGLASPDDADALACTFAEPVLPREKPAYLDRTRWTGRDAARGEEGDLYAELRE